MAITVLKRDLWVPDQLKVPFNPKSEFGKYVRECLKYLPVHMATELIDRISSITILESALSIVHLQKIEEHLHNGVVFVQQRPLDYGIVSRKVVTTAGVGFLVDAWQNSVELENMKYHGVGTNNTAESSSDTALGAESTTALNPDSTRATGSTTEGASANIFRSVGTLTADNTIAAVEHGLFSQAATGGGVLWDRSIFSTVTLVSGDSIQFTYDLTASAGG